MVRKPDGVAEEYHVVTRHVLDGGLRRDGWARVGIVLLDGCAAFVVAVVEVAFGVRRLRNDLKQVGAQTLGNCLRDGACIARAGEIGDQNA